MPVFIAFAAFLLLVFGPRLGLPIGPWIVTTGPFGPKRKTPGQKSGVRTEALEMVLDHDSGQMEGSCLKGRYAGKPLSSMTRHQLLQLLEELRITDTKGALLMEAYLDRRVPGWRDLGSSCSDQEEPRSGRPGGMTTADAYEVLGLKPGAKEAAIRAAHRRLMMKFHPDQGGSTFLAARINEAKAILLARR
jgi:DnaJ domain